MSVVDDIALVAEHERVLVFQRFDEVTALEIGNAIRVLAEAAGANLVIDIRFWNRPLYYYAMPGSGPDNFEWVRRKSNCVRRFNKASYAFTLRAEARRQGLCARRRCRPDGNRGARRLVPDPHSRRERRRRDHGFRGSGTPRPWVRGRGNCTAFGHRLRAAEPYRPNSGMDA